MTHGLKLLPFESLPASILQNRDLSFKPFLFFYRTLLIITEIVREHVPNLNHIEAEDFVRNEYKSFKDFSVRDEIAQALKRMNPNIPEVGVSEIFEAVRKRFNNPEREHEYFLFFVISRIIELQSLSISRGTYLLEISRGRIPRPSRFVSFFQMRRQVARYKMAKDRMKGEHL
jgi:hypothetical protein